MSKCPDYTIRTRPVPEASRKDTESKNPKVTLNTAPVSRLTDGSTAPVIEPVPIETDIPYEVETVPYVEEAVGRSGFMGGKKRNRNRNMHRLFAMRITGIVGGAIAVGLLFGYAALQMLAVPEKKQPPVPARSTAVRSDVQVPSPAASVPKPKAEAVVPAAQTKSVALAFPALSLYMVQGGVFTTKEGAMQEQAAYKQKGWPVYQVADGGKYAVFLGMGISKEDAVSIAQMYRDAGQAVYVKEKSVAASSVAITVPEGLAAKEVANITKIGEVQAALFKELSAMAGTGFRDGKVAPERMQRAVELHQQLLEKGRSLLAVTEEKKKPFIQAVLNEATTSVAAMKQFGSQSNRTYLWQAEEAMMKWMEASKLWQNSMKQ
ncbi:sporulation related protein [Aneurinibacillus soli]|uniref:Uncharacterized protein n=1 Tax=Aneurinibacillus soli TaxID=1500254 RepID=A0A0U5AT99_9BACL|nr:SPOR domain-containing protein [Aneurinibacillus soli]PYE62430.1 sporulation related protein [Aneurinibacillus soli]BAU26993.1 hypothetical protein CB4_01162 [Aneurinibacillus soli]